MNFDAYIQCYKTKELHRVSVPDREIKRVNWIRSFVMRAIGMQHIVLIMSGDSESRLGYEHTTDVYECRCIGWVKLTTLGYSTLTDYIASSEQDRMEFGDDPPLHIEGLDTIVW